MREQVSDLTLSHSLNYSQRLQHRTYTHRPGPGMARLPNASRSRPRVQIFWFTLLESSMRASLADRFWSLAVRGWHNRRRDVHLALDAAASQVMQRAKVEI